MSKKAVLLTIGNEILSGDVIDDNSNWIAKKLFSLGVELSYIFVIPDTKEIIKKFLIDYKDNFDFVITVGGMGPTPDDVTKDAIAEVFNVNLEKNNDIIELIKKHYGNDVSEQKFLMAIFPQNAKPILTSEKNWAVGMINNNVFSFPGTPWLMKDAFLSIEDLLKDEPIFKTKININCEETIFADIMTDICKKYPEVDVGSYPSNKDFRNVKILFKSRDKKKIIECRDEFVYLLSKRYTELEIS